MTRRVALQRYLQRHIEPGLPAAPCASGRWHDVLVLPVYRESPRLVARLQATPAGRGRSLVILVLNRPDSDPDTHANDSLRQALAGLPAGDTELPPGIRQLSPHSELYLHDIETLHGPTPSAQGVGLARKSGCDIALSWMAAGAITGSWIYSTDADATLPPDYFLRLAGDQHSSAAVFPFHHRPGPDQQCNEATALYELRLHHYVLGLEYAGSPYAHHSLGSCLAVRGESYAQVHGFPRRSGAEDFYLLNKLAKLGTINRLGGSCVQLQARYSARVPFGTGPAVARISTGGEPMQQALFYHPQSFLALRAVLAALPRLAEDPDRELARLLPAQGIDNDLLQAILAILDDMGIAAALAHCARQAKSTPQFLRHFHQWFDAFRTLKFIHALRDAGWQDQSLDSVGELEPLLWPMTADDSSSAALLDSLFNHWHWLHW